MGGTDAKYIAAGIAVSSILVALLLFLDFLRYLRKKSKVRNNIQRRQHLNGGSQRPFAFFLGRHEDQKTGTQLNSNTNCIGQAENSNGYQQLPPLLTKETFKQKSRKGRKKKKQINDNDKECREDTTVKRKRGGRRSKKVHNMSDTLDQLTESMDRVIAYKPKDVGDNVGYVRKTAKYNNMDKSKSIKDIAHSSNMITDEELDDLGSRRYCSKERVVAETVQKSDNSQGLLQPGATRARHRKAHNQLLQSVHEVVGGSAISKPSESVGERDPPYASSSVLSSSQGFSDVSLERPLSSTEPIRRSLFAQYNNFPLQPVTYSTTPQNHTKAGKSPNGATEAMATYAIDIPQGPQVDDRLASNMQNRSLTEYPVHSQLLSGHVLGQLASNERTGQVPRPLPKLPAQMDSVYASDDFQQVHM